MRKRYLNGCGRNGAGLWLAAAAALALAACAEEHPPGPGGPGGPRAEGRGRPDGDGPPGEGRGPRRAALFISPAGEPFRAGPGEPYPVAAWFLRADANGDGKLTKDEFVADAARFFQRLDTNGDGVIDGIELKTYETEVVPEITADRGGGEGAAQRAPQAAGGYGGGGDGRGGGGRGGRGGGRQDGPGGGRGQGQGPGQGPGQGQGGGGPAGGGGGGPQFLGAAPYSLTGDREPVAGADLDLNGRISLANFKTRAGQRFDRLDTDRQGFLSLETLPKTQAQKAGARPRRNRPPPG